MNNKKNIDCKWEKRPSGCRSKACAFKHWKGVPRTKENMDLNQQLITGETVNYKAALVTADEPAVEDDKYFASSAEKGVYLCVLCFISQIAYS